MNRRLLVLDDDPTIGAMLVMIAESVGFDAIATTEPPEFFRLLEQARPSHIALDLVMPEMDGVEVIHHLAARGCSAGIIISSGVGGRVLDAARRSAAEHGLKILGTLSKPFTPAAFRALLRAQPEPEPSAAPAALREIVPRERADPDIAAEDISEALARHEIFLAYQPQVSCRGDKLEGFEALVRWRHSRLGVVMPNRFIPLAEEAGLIDALTDRVVDIGLAWLAASFPDRSDEAPPVTLSINISPASIGSRDLVQTLVTACNRHRVAPHRIILELTETSTMRDPIATLDQLTRLRMKGFQLSIDDFGTGFSSMLQLARLPFSEIKIDKSFVMTVLQSLESRAVVRSVIDLGKSFGLRTVAEGVEDASTLEFLRARGCDIAQGYHIGRPMPESEIGDWLAARQPASQKVASVESSHRPASPNGAFRWDEEFLTGLDEVDKQHRHLVGLVNGFSSAVLEGSEISRGQMESLFSELVDYAHYHFREEESVMAEAGLDEGYVEFHRGEHEGVIEELMLLKKAADPDRPETLQPTLSFLIHWLAFHILGVDQGMARQVAAVRDGVHPSDAAQRERHGGGGGRGPLVRALAGLFELLAQNNRHWREQIQLLEGRLAEQSEALAHAYSKLEANAKTDPLTGIPNRRYALEILDFLWSRRRGDSRRLASLVINVDRFRKVNDLHGHEAGDAVLRALALRLQEAIRPDDVICRLGGDEFLVIVPEADPEDAEHLASTLLDKARQLRVPVGEAVWKGSVSIGIAVSCEAMSEPGDLVEAARRALAAAQDAGRGRVAVAESQGG